jgi:hypothetical protein
VFVFTDWFGRKYHHHHHHHHDVHEGLGVIIIIMFMKVEA